MHLRYYEYLRKKVFGQLCVFILTVNERSELPVKTKKIQHDPTHTIQCSLTKAVTQVAARNLWSLPDPGVCKPTYIPAQY